MKQITVICQQTEGLLAKIAELLADADINIESLEAADVGQWGLIHLSVNKYNEALAILRDNNINAISEDAIVVDIPDAPGALAKITKTLHDNNIHVHSIRILHRENKNALVAVATEDNESAKKLLTSV